MERLYTSPTYGMWYPGMSRHLVHRSYINPLSSSRRQVPQQQYATNGRLPGGLFVLHEVAALARGPRRHDSTLDGGDESAAPRRRWRDCARTPAATEGGQAQSGRRGHRPARDRRAVRRDRTVRPRGHREAPSRQDRDVGRAQRPRIYDLVRRYHRDALRELVWDGCRSFCSRGTQDADYIRKWYVSKYEPDLAVSNLHGRDESSRIQKAKEIFMPMYYIKNVSHPVSFLRVNAHARPQVPEDPRKLEMNFDCNVSLPRASIDHCLPPILGLPIPNAEGTVLRGRDLMVLANKECRTSHSRIACSRLSF
jgi:hypothetical protein